MIDKMTNSSCENRVYSDSSNKIKYHKDELLAIRDNMKPSELILPDNVRAIFDNLNLSTSRSSNIQTIDSIRTKVLGHDR